jgi:hypothetical protein
VEGHVDIQLPLSVVIVSMCLEVVAEGGSCTVNISWSNGWWVLVS